MNLTLYKRRRLRQKPHILTIEQSRELGQLVGKKVLKHVTDQGLIPINLFRLRKKKLEMIYKYLFDHQLIHDKQPIFESLQTHQLAEYLLNIIYPGYPACKAKNLAYTDYRLCREKDTGLTPLAYDYVPTTEVYERLDELYRMNIDWKENTAIEIPICTLKRAIDRIRAANFMKPFEFIEYHLYFWNSPRTLLKPQCKSLCLNQREIWSEKKEKIIAEGFMHIDITKQLEQSISERSKKIKLDIKLANNDEYNINHISISAVIKRPTQDLVRDLYLQTTTECIAKSIQTSLCPLDTQQIAVHLLKQYQESKDKLKASENLFLTCLSNTFNKNLSSSEEDDEDKEEDMVSLVDPVSGTRIQHPVKSLHCKHRSCFDAATFFDRNADIKLWHCPICLVHIKNTEELRVDYVNKVALAQYPQEEKLFVLQKDTLLSEAEMFGDETILIQEDLKRSLIQDDEAPVQKRLRTLTHVM
ncbi:hypothetical protein MFLAVUS_008408 [Mucor flavus]|uniref:SP-RING-type domain-containing protein n=1 Tax=Mucor flavus TaxID=439312 RepID=A0ABP9Z708_9FUNG